MKKDGSLELVDGASREHITLLPTWRLPVLNLNISFKRYRTDVDDSVSVCNWGHDKQSNSSGYVKAFDIVAMVLFKMWFCYVEYVLSAV